MADHAAGEFTQVLFEDVASVPHAAAHQVHQLVSVFFCDSDFRVQA